MTTILAVESSTKACSVSLLYKGKSHTEFKIAPQQHANLMLIMVDSVLKKVGIKGKDIDILSFCEGPGAFTGIRIATGVIQGLAYGWDKPVLGVSSLDTLAWQAYKENNSLKIIACLDARMNELYLQECEIIEGKLNSTIPKIISEENANKLIKKAGVQSGIGDIAEEFPELIKLFSSWNSAYPNAQFVADIASQRIKQAKNLREKIPLPLYLRNNIAIKKEIVK